MKKLIVAIKAIVLLCASALVTLRLASYKLDASLSPQIKSTMLKVSIVCAVVLGVCGVLWAVLEKRNDKKEFSSRQSMDKEDKNS